MAPRCLLQAGHWPDDGGAPGETPWSHLLAEQIAARLREYGVEVAIIGGFYRYLPTVPTWARDALTQDWSLFLSLHYDYSGYGETRNTGAFADTDDDDVQLAESNRFVAVWEGLYFPATGLRNAIERRNLNTDEYYALQYTSANTPSAIIEHGCGANAGKWWQGRWYPPGQDAALLHDRLDFIAALDAAAILHYLGMTPADSAIVPIVLPGEETTNVAILSDAQAEIVATVLWDARGVVFNPASAIGRGWVARWRAGAYAGRPMGPERTLPGGVVVQEFDAALACWVPGEAEASWAG